MTPSTDLRIASLRFEHLDDPLGIGASSPRLSWTVQTGTPGWAQAAYEIEISDATGNRSESFGPVASGESVLVGWPAAPLRSRERRQVRVRVWGRDDSASPWSRATRVEAGLLSTSDWTARAIGTPAAGPRPTPGPATLFRKAFRVGPGLQQARLYITAHGIYDVEVNGRPVGDAVLSPGWTSYAHRLRYYTYDVADLLEPGDNVLGSTVADGWYRGRLGFHGGLTGVYGDRIALCAQLELSYLDGSTEAVVSDGTWTCAPGPVVSTSLYDGERHDARRHQPGWSTAGFTEVGWLAVDVLDLDTATLVAPAGPPVRRVQTLPPVSAKPAPSGGTIVDFGQNISGRLRIRVQGQAGDTVTIGHAEELEDGELAVRPLRLAAQRDSYTLRGDAGGEVWEPRFTIHGFRYAELQGWPGGRPDDADVNAVVCHTDMRRTGWFECSDPRLNRLHENVVWSMRGNFVDIPTDCPQRDERLGWTGDIAVFAPTASFLYDCAGMLTSWLADLAVEQAHFGTVPHYVPWLQLIFDLTPAAVWGDAAVIVPWVLYQRFGDAEILRQQYPSMTAWVDQVSAAAGGSHLWKTGFQFGDWLDPAAPPERPGASLTDRYLIATAFHAYTTQLLAQAAEVLGQSDDAHRYTALAEHARRAFNDEYVTPNGRLSSDTQTAYAVALQLDLLPGAGQRERAGRRLADLVTQAEHHIATGFVGTPFVCDALTGAGEIDTAYQLLLQTECPSWLYPVTMGATTIWERWDSLLPDGRINPGGMTSFNHYALGAVADWMHRTVAGLAPAAPGYRRIRIAPRPGGGLTHARAEHITPYGPATVSWQRDRTRLEVTVTVPPGTRAEIDLPSADFTATEVGPGTHIFSCTMRPADADPTAARPAYTGPSSSLPAGASTVLNGASEVGG